MPGGESRLMFIDGEAEAVGALGCSVRRERVRSAESVRVSRTTHKMPVQVEITFGVPRLSI